MKLLEHKADFIGAVARQFAFSQAAPISRPSTTRAPGGRMIEPAENIDQRRLAGAGRPHDGDPLARLHVEDYTDRARALRRSTFRDDRPGPTAPSFSSQNLGGRTRPSKRNGKAPASATPIVKATVKGKTSSARRNRHPEHATAQSKRVKQNPNQKSNHSSDNPQHADFGQKQTLSAPIDPPSAFINPTSPRRSIASAAIVANTLSAVSTKISAAMETISN